jgi:5-methylcytosine-specific restriction endonuclease McrA
MKDEIKQAVRQRAKYLCEYCHSSERLSASRFTVDHLTPRSLGGSDDLNNLALACRRCNERRYNFVVGIDPETQETVPIFNPRLQEWDDHFKPRLS